MRHDLYAEKKSTSTLVNGEKKMIVSVYIILSFMQKEGMHYLLCASQSSKLLTHLFICTSQLYQVL